MRETVSRVEDALKQADFVTAIQLLRSWLATCQPGQLWDLLEACSLPQRQRVKLMICDLLSRYPRTVLGCPLLVYATPDSAQASIEQTALKLPHPQGASVFPTADLQFLGWLPANVKLPVRWPLRPGDFDTNVNWYTPTVCIALFRSRVDEFDEVNIPAMWWAEVFSDGPLSKPSIGNVRIEGRLLLDYPAAVEVAAAMQAGARREPLPDHNVFQQDLGWAAEVGLAFYEDCLWQLNNSVD